MNDLSLIEALKPINWPTLVLVAARLSGLFLIAPLWSQQSIPKSVRGALVIVLSAAMLPSVSSAVLPEQWMLLPVPLLSEMMIGLAIGMVGAIFMWGITMAGEVMSLQMGLNLGEAIGLAEAGAPTGVGELKTMLVIILYITMDGHLILLQGLADSFRVIAPGVAIRYTEGSNALVALSGSVFETGLRAAAPVTAALLLVNFGLAILNKAVPQLNAMSTAFPITMGVGLVVIGLSLPYLGRFVAGWNGGLGAQSAGIVDIFATGAR